MPSEAEELERVKNQVGSRERYNAAAQKWNDWNKEYNQEVNHYNETSEKVTKNFNEGPLKHFNNNTDHGKEALRELQKAIDIRDAVIQRARQQLQCVESRRPPMPQD
ncbi:hypothetical protein BT63DRAFT_458937 [Microthyrium microscopicum]|uniref:Putative T7SS secretion signal domain-containing protein n=1 Tax=Microthyrium microscopicum TaxID=703497 RepID=A0A6A6TZ60_9PEZI|nr:hypothetical protein BT63DRAFT_458937 [Microthyrium microscopicum]